MVAWKNLDTLTAFENLKALKNKVDIKVAMAGENGAKRVNEYKVPMAEGMSFNYAAKQVDDEVLAVLADLAKEYCCEAFPYSSRRYAFMASYASLHNFVVAALSAYIIYFTYLFKQFTTLVLEFFNHAVNHGSQAGIIGAGQGDQADFIVACVIH